MELRVVRVNGVDVTNSSQEEILTLIENATKPITLEVNNELHRNDNDRNNLETAGVKLTFTKNVREINLTNNVREMEIQTEAERSLCDNCRDFYNSFYNYNYDSFPLDPDNEENFIYPDLQYEVKLHIMMIISCDRKENFFFGLYFILEALSSPQFEVGSGSIKLIFQMRAKQGETFKVER